MTPIESKEVSRMILDTFKRMADNQQDFWTYGSLCQSKGCAYVHTIKTILSHWTQVYSLD
jgi:hypothetical protein